MSTAPLSRSLRAAAAIYYFSGIAFALSNVAVMFFVGTQGRVPIVLGVDLDGGGPFETLGSRWMTLLIGLFVVVCLLEVVAARWLSQSAKRGGFLGVAVLPAGAIFWFGFALPLPWLLGLAKAILLAVGWRRLRP
jgi:hypothetical protein